MSVFLTRSEYDYLVRTYPEWMARYWPTMRPRWYLRGPAVDSSDIESTPGAADVIASVPRLAANANM